MYMTFIETVKITRSNLFAVNCNITSKWLSICSTTPVQYIMCMEYMRIERTDISNTEAVI